jgi:murein DD-endopeptidase MepM/ murein hydrolase activator NlpD
MPMARRFLAVSMLLLLLAGPPPAEATRHGSAALRPVPGAVLRPFDPPDTPYGAGHRGVDLQAAPGDAVRSALDGVVAFSGLVAGAGWVTVRHGGGLETTYGLLDPRVVGAGHRVARGGVLGRLAPAAAHLDWGAKLDGAYIDPLSLLQPWEVHLTA